MLIGVDKLLAIANLQHKHGKTDLAFGKADVKAAYRRIPICPEHRKFSWVAFATKDKTYVSR